jgi:hypothetical protein
MISNVSRGKKAVVGVLTVIFSLTLVTGAYAEGGLNGIGGQEPSTSQTQTTPQTQPVPQTAPQTTQQTATAPPSTTSPTGESNSSVVGGLFNGIGVDGEASQKANAYMAPFAKMSNLLFALILLIASLGLFLITALDLLYISVPPLRNLLYQGGQSQGAPSGGMGMGMGGMGGFGGGGFGGGGFGGGGMMGGQQQQQPSFVSRFISDEAVAAVEGLQGSSQPQGGMMGMMGGQQQQPKMKSVILSYLKKRVFFLLAFGVCAVLLSTTIFTDLGVKLGGWMLTRLLGLKDNFPQ